MTLTLSRRRGPAWSTRKAAACFGDETTRWLARPTAPTGVHVHGGVLVGGNIAFGGFLRSTDRAPSAISSPAHSERFFFSPSMGLASAARVRPGSLASFAPVHEPRSLAPPTATIAGLQPRRPWPGDPNRSGLRGVWVPRPPRDRARFVITRIGAGLFHTQGGLPVDNRGLVLRRERGSGDRQSVRGPGCAAWPSHQRPPRRGAGLCFSGTAC